MKKEIMNLIRFDKEGELWFVDLQRTTYYPDGNVDKLVLKNKWEQKTFVRYNQIGEPICGNLSLA